MSQQNHNVSYLFEIDGLTTWERLRVVRNFLEDREIALALAELPADETKVLTAREVAEAKIYEKQRLGNIQNARDEIKFLKEFEKTLIPLAEITRIPGKTDMEMYELNYMDELVERQLLKVKSEIMSQGVLSANTFEMLMKSPPTINRALELNIISEAVVAMLNLGKETSKVLKIEDTSKNLLTYLPN
jgi:hypothetical protein